MIKFSFWIQATIMRNCHFCFLLWLELYFFSFHDVGMLVRTVFPVTVIQFLGESTERCYDDVITRILVCCKAPTYLLPRHTFDFANGSNLSRSTISQEIRYLTHHTRSMTLQRWRHLEPLLTQLHLPICNHFRIEFSLLVPIVLNLCHTWTVVPWICVTNKCILLSYSSLL